MSSVSDIKLIRTDFFFFLKNLFQFQIQISIQKSFTKTVQSQNPVLQFFVTKSQIIQSSSVRGHKVKIIYMKSCESRKQNPLQKPLIA